MMGLSDGRKSFRIGFAVLIQYRSVTASHPASHVAVAITLNAKASSLKRSFFNKIYRSVIVYHLKCQLKKSHVELVMDVLNLAAFHQQL